MSRKYAQDGVIFEVEVVRHNAHGAWAEMVITPISMDGKPVGNLPYDLHIDPEPGNPIIYDSE